MDLGVLGKLLPYIMFSLTKLLFQNLINWSVCKSNGADDKMQKSCVYRSWCWSYTIHVLPQIFGVIITNISPPYILTIKISTQILGQAEATSVTLKD